MKLSKYGLIALIAIATFVAQPLAAHAGESVRVPGQVSVDQCPLGYQYNTGIEVNVSTHEEFTICNAPPTEAELILRQQDADFWAAQRAAQDGAEAESRAWNAANPGMQKCIQWGPIVHANGVSTASGGVCANPVGANDANVLPTAPATSVDATEPVYTTQSIDAVDGPFTRTVEGQVGIEGCPAGYQGANGLVIDASTGRQTTTCWMPNAWKAWVLGGPVWEQFQTSGGTYDVNAELDRRAKLASLKARAKSVAQAAANLTPGVRRCSDWSGYGEAGTECAYAFVAPNGGSMNHSGDSTDSIDARDSTATFSNPSSNLSADARDSGITVSAASITTAKGFTIVNTSKQSKVTTKSLTPKICSVSNLKVKAKTHGTCVISYLSKAPNGKVSTTRKTIIFAKTS